MRTFPPAEAENPAEKFTDISHLGRHEEWPVLSEVACWLDAGSVFASK
ncbi:MAG: hypothetical protein OJF47_002181 [Nitrospira sp.]|nr:MAG: hypothetical protein OJF47_002181 [Nitrospira sp.]